MTNLDFPSWLQNELDSRGWSQADFARETKLSTGGVAQLLNGRRNPGPDACTAMARAFGYPPDLVFREAGLLPPKSNVDEQTERLLHLYNQMTDDEREEWVALGEFVFSRRKVKKLRTVEG